MFIQLKTMYAYYQVDLTFTITVVMFQMQKIKEIKEQF